MAEAYFLLSIDANVGQSNMRRIQRAPFIYAGEDSMRTLQWVLGIALAGSLGIFARPAQAMTLADLMASGGQIVQGDLVYSHFYAAAPLGPPSTHDSLGPEDITVTMIPDGLRFSAAWSASLPQTERMDASLGYQVAVLGPAAIQEVGVTFGGVNFSGDGMAEAEEQVNDLDDASNYCQMQIVHPVRFLPPPGGAIPVDSTSVRLTSSMRNVRISELIFVAVPPYEDYATASLSFVDSTFRTVVPEPAPAALVLLALGGLTSHTRRRLSH